MDDGQNRTPQNSEPPVTGDKVSTARPVDLLTLQQRQWIDYCALGGLLTEADGSHPGGQSMSVQDFANTIGVARSTLYKWRETIPNFWQLVGQRTADLFSETRTLKVIKSIYINATVKMNPQAQAMWMANQKLIEFRMPTQPVKHEAAGSLLDVLELARRRVLETGKVIEGEVVEPPNQNPNA